MQKAILLCVAALLSFLAPAQDQLFKTDNSKILVKVLEVGPEEVKYKLFNDPAGPVYVVSKKNVALIIYQSGEHQLFNQGMPSPAPSAQSGPTTSPVFESNLAMKEKRPDMTAADSLIYYRHENCLSVNFLNFFNNELGITYRKEFFKSQFSIIIPFAIGLAEPNVTQQFYFNTNPVRVELHKKIFDVGFGAHYYPSLKSRNNYYIGPVFKYMQYDVSQVAMSWPNYLIASNSTVLSRYAFSLTNGLICRTRSRLTTNVYISMGFKNDKVADPLKDPAGDLITTLKKPVAFYWWSGFEVGFSF